MKPYPPPGFDAFWRENVAEAESAVLDYEVGSPTEVSVLDDGQTITGTISDRHEIRTMTFRGIAGELLHGWIATPDATPAPAFLWIAHYGRESSLPNQFGTREGMVSLGFNFFGLPAFHREKYTPARGYLKEGVEGQDRWVFRTMFQNAVIASRVLADLPSVDKTRIASVGMSQGGGMSIWLGAWVDRIRTVCADMPFLGAMHETLMQNVYRYPLKELMDLAATQPGMEPTILHTISFYDTLNQATRCAKPTQVSLGLKDPAVKPNQVHAIFEALPGIKRLIEYPGGHDWDDAMIENNRLWLLAY